VQVRSACGTHGHEQRINGFHDRVSRNSTMCALLTTKVPSPFST
jgi:hypothetical protein